jgi:hypothetical protein
LFSLYSSTEKTAGEHLSNISSASRSVTSKRRVFRYPVIRHACHNGRYLRARNVADGIEGSHTVASGQNTPR